MKCIVLLTSTTLKRKCHHFDESFITGCTESCHFDNFRCSQWWRFHQNEDIFVSVNVTARCAILSIQVWSLPWNSASTRSICHYGDVIIGAIVFTIVYSSVYSDADQRKHQSSGSLAFVRGIHRSPVNSPHKWPVTRKMFPFDDVIMVLLMCSNACKLFCGIMRDTTTLLPVVLVNPTCLYPFISTSVNQ